MDGHLQAPGSGRDEQVGHAPALRHAEENPLARGAENEDPVEPAVDERVDVRADSVRVERVACVEQRRHRRRKRTAEGATGHQGEDTQDQTAEVARPRPHAARGPTLESRRSRCTIAAHTGRRRD
jgi:hypothetical protein